MPRLIFAKQAELVGYLRVKSIEHAVLKLKQILILPFGVANNLNDEDFSQAECDINFSSVSVDNSFSLVMTPSLSSSSNAQPTVTVNASDQSPASPTKSPSSNAYLSAANAAISTSSSPPLSSTAAAFINDNSKLEKKLIDEIEKIFQENGGSFYFSYTYDLTNTLERQQELVEGEASKSSEQKKRSSLKTCWKYADDRFFWNKALLEHLIDLNENSRERSDKSDASVQSDLSAIDNFIVPLIQGFFEMETFDNRLPSVCSKIKLESGSSKNLKANESRITSVQKSGELIVQLRLCLISRRSRYRLGITAFYAIVIF
jgi:hypothetical protein